VTQRNARYRLGALVCLGLIVVTAAVALRRPQSSSHLPWRKHAELRGTSLPVLHLTDGAQRPLADGRAHIVYLFASNCAPCTSQRLLMARMLSTVDRDVVITASTERLEAVSDYWSTNADSLSGAALPTPVAIDAEWLRETKLPVTLPALIFVTPDGRISQFITGPVLSWTANTLRKELVVAQTRQSF